MKKLFFALTLLTSFSLFASTVQTTFSAQVKFKRADGKIKKLSKVRVITRHNSEASILRPSSLEDCQIEAGKNDVFSLFTESEAYSCFATKNTLVMSSETLQAIIDRSISMSIFASNDLFYTLENMLDNGTVVSDAPGGAINSVVNRLGRNVLGSGSVELMRLDGSTHFKIEDERGLEAFDIDFSIKKVEYLN